MFVFLDFDGTMHPVRSLTEPKFCRLELFENWLRKWPFIKVVISSSWREQHSFDEMQSYFSEDLQGRIIGVTPVSTGLGAEQLPLRQIEIEQWLADNDEEGQPWIAFDDDESLFKAGCRNLVLCDPTVGLSTATLDVAELRIIDSSVSDRTLQLSKILDLATSVLGSQDAAEQWLLRPALGLDQSRPIDLLKSTEGIITVTDFLVRIKYGVYV